MKYLGIDIGGTWIKGVAVEDHFFGKNHKTRFRGFNIQMVENTLSAHSTSHDLLLLLNELISKFKLNLNDIHGIGISTAGIVNYHGTKVVKAVEYLNFLKEGSWKPEIEAVFDCTSSIINDADATTIGLVELGLLKGNKTVGVMPVGTGIGFAVWRNGRRWRPGKLLTLLGSIRTPAGRYDSIASASKLASMDKYGGLNGIFTKGSNKEVRGSYMNDLVHIIQTAAIIYNLDEVIVCGGLAAAVTECNYPLEDELNARLTEQMVELEEPVHAYVSKEGNNLQLIGALALARWESAARSKQVVIRYETISTEIPYKKDVQLQELSTDELLRMAWEAEQEAGKYLEKSLPVIGNVIDNIFKKIKDGGRLVYVGAGTSGRIAAMDAIEIPCTYGFPEDRIACLIAGGIADASIEIESDFEEDASAVPEMLLLNIGPYDTVIGISASGAAYYVQSALAMAKDKGAYTVLIQSFMPERQVTFCDDIIPLNSGYELVAGSTRLKAGTATKKILNFISSSLMIKMGKVAGPYMIDVACINEKLVERAQDILTILYGMNKKEAYERLKKADMQLKKVIDKIHSGE